LFKGFNDRLKLILLEIRTFPSGSIFLRYLPEIYSVKKGEETMSSREEYVRKMQAKLEEWNTDIDSLTTKAHEVSDDVRREINDQIAVLQAKQVAAQQKFEELTKNGDSAWEDLKAGIDLAWTAIGESIDSAKSRFKKE
jgi:predicted  nucleic acid-binding Zn-ribbon protein